MGGKSFMLKDKNILSLKGKIAIVTGAASGIGFATSELLAEYGAQVVMLDINEEKGREAAEKIEKTGDKAVFIKCDITSSAACQRVVSDIKGKFGRIDILHNNAGIIVRKTVVELDEKEWDLVIDVSIKGTYLMSKYVIPVMVAGGGGSIINTGSGWGLKGGDNAASYCAAKGGVVNLTRAMAIDHGKQNIRVNCVCPGDTDTPMLRGEARQLGVDEENYIKSSGKRRPLQRVGAPRDVANSVLFLASDLSSWVTGSALVVDGGGLA
jgi:NAD(P)-dependent dehydrogenase (short-subunit alcohol dehydrogenase family)